MSSRNWAGNSRCRLNVQLLMYPGLPAPGFIYSIVPPLASVGSIFGRLAVTAGRPLSRRSAETRSDHGLFIHRIGDPNARRESLVKGRCEERSRLQKFEGSQPSAGAGIRQA